MTIGGDPRRYRVFVLGAGFSQPAGLPLASELWQQVRGRAKHLTGRATMFWDDLEAYVQFRSDCDGVTLAPDEVDLEDFIASLDIEHYLGLRGSDTYTADGNESQLVVKTLIGQVLAEATPSIGRVPDLYVRFASLLQPNDYVLTFNYDVLLERALETIGKPFRLFPERLRDVRPEAAVVDTSHDEVVILKLHGSIDWFDRTHYARSEARNHRHGLSPDPHPVFTNMAQLHVSRLLDGPRFPNDPLREMYRVGEVDKLYQTICPLSCTPWLVNPSSVKMLYFGPLRDFWWGLSDAGRFNLGMAIIGFSLSRHDHYALAALYRIIKNYQDSSWDEKTPLVLVDKRNPDEEQKDFRRRYAFVDWDKATTCMDGFDDHAIDIIFGKSTD